MNSVKFLVSVLGIVGTCWGGDHKDLWDLSARFGNLTMKNVPDGKKMENQSPRETTSLQGTPDFPKPSTISDPYDADGSDGEKNPEKQNSNKRKPKKPSSFKNSSGQKSAGRPRAGSFCGSDGEGGKVLKIINSSKQIRGPKTGSSPQKPGAGLSSDRRG